MKRDLLLGLALVAGISSQAATSPYTGSVAEEGTYYLYQVETGMWLQPNMTIFDQWTTYSTLDEVGIDVELKKLEGFEGFQIYCDFNNNGSLNGADGDRFFLDQFDRDITDWIFEPVTVEGVTNAYKIMAKATPEGTGERSVITEDFYIGATAGGELTDAPDEFTWQLVSREERLKKMVADAANGPVDASWLIPGFDLGRNDLRYNRWSNSIINEFVGGLGHDGANGYPVQEYWHQIKVHRMITLTGLPTGTYSFSVQAFYRDGNENEEATGQRYEEGTDNHYATYFAGATTGEVMSVYAQAKDEETDGYKRQDPYLGVWVPGGLGDAAKAMYDGGYVNDYIQAPVKDGSLTIGIDKQGYAWNDWFIVKRFYLRYDSTTPIAEDLTALQTQLQGLIEAANQLPATPMLTAAIADATLVLSTATTSAELLEAIADLTALNSEVSSSKGIIETYNATKVITNQLNIEVADADEIFASAKTKGEFEDALKHLRYDRRIAVADRQADVFEGNEPAPGKFYIYNVGRGLFLCGGSDWGAHAALGLPGVEIELQEATQNGAGQQKYYIETGLYESVERHFLNYRGYMDATQVDGFVFLPVEGKERVYYIVQGDYTDVHMAWYPYAGTDAGNNDETTVGTEMRDLDKSDLNAQWKLVTREERDALIEKASLSNPVDLTHMIKSPGFNQREDITDWSFGEYFKVWDRGANHNDFVAESWNTMEADLAQSIAGAPAGVYKVSVQGFYRDGNFENQVDAEQISNACLYAGLDQEDDVFLPNIMAESGKAPGEGAKITSAEEVEYEYPNDCVQATSYFKSGLYKTYTVIEHNGEDDLLIGVTKYQKGMEEDWIVVDNFRLTYYGNETTKEAVKESLTSGIEEVVAIPAARVEDNRIFNLQGIEVVNPTVPGIYIQNGKKFIVR